MAARRWFTLDNTSGLTVTDLSVLNCAARNYWPAGGAQPSQRELAVLRTSFVPGMSANDLLDTAIDNLILAALTPIPANQRGSIPEAVRRSGRRTS